MSTTTQRSHPRLNPPTRAKELRACAELLAELLRSDQIPFEEQQDEARALLTKAGIEV